MNYFIQLIDTTNNILWTYILIALLLGCACWFTIRTHFVQFRMLGEMIHLLGDSTARINGHEKHISSFQAFTLSLASRVGTGNLAGVATAITMVVREQYSGCGSSLCWDQAVLSSNPHWPNSSNERVVTLTSEVLLTIWKRD